MKDMLLTPLAGVIAAFCMAGIYYLVSHLTRLRFNALEALGSLITRKSSERMGFVVHLIFGALFAYLYVLLWSALGLPHNEWALAFGAGLGLVHGFVVSFWLVILVAEHHPVRAYRKQGFRIALSDIAGHAVFGLIIGLCVSALDINFDAVTSIAAQSGFGPIAWNF